VMTMDVFEEFVGPWIREVQVGFVKAIFYIR
jgi:hypothetical protein